MSNYNNTLKILSELKEKYPSYNLGRHISTALSDYGDPWGMSDREMFFAFEKYISELELDYHTVSEDFVNQIVKDAENLTLEEDE